MPFFALFFFQLYQKLTLFIYFFVQTLIVP